MLRNDYYVGIVTRNGVKVQGRHEAIIDQSTFDRVQEILTAHAASGDRTSKHNHYLGGSIFCGRCGARFSFGRHRSKSGKHYEYFCCLSRIRPGSTCVTPHLSVAAVEEAVERAYESFVLTKDQRRAIRGALREYANGKADVARHESERHTRRLRELTELERTPLPQPGS
jgi:hypothetical protein